MGARDAAQHTVVCRMASPPPTENDLVLISIVLKGGTVPRLVVQDPLRCGASTFL